MSNYHLQRAAEILKSSLYTSVATITPQGKPWNTPLRFVYDEELTFYWFSDKENEHSKNVRHTADVFLVMFDSHAPEGQGEGVYIEAKAYEVADPAVISRARRIKKGVGHDAPDDFMGEAVRRVYAAVPRAIWVNDYITNKNEFVRDSKQPVDIIVLKNLLNASK